MGIRVSIVLTYYNGSNYLHEQLSSIAKQTLRPDEIIIMDDCSDKEEAYYLLNEIRECKLNKISTIITNERNIGYAENFRKGIKAAQGKYIFLCDQDDVWMDSKIKEMVSILDNDMDINLLCCDIEPFYSDENAPRWDPHSLKDMINDSSLEKCNDIRKNHHLRRSGCTMAIRKTFFENIDKYWIYMWPHDDFIWKMSVYNESCAIFHKILQKRRLHLNNTSELKIRTRQWRIDEIKSMIEQHKVLLKYAQEIHCEEKKSKLIQHNIKSLVLRKKFLIKKNPFLWVKIVLFYSDTYTGRWKGILLDAYLTYFNTLKGGSL